MGMEGRLCRISETSSGCKNFAESLKVAGLTMHVIHMLS
jgi:hypothetical protein